MTARLFRCTIKNAGGAPIAWVGDHLDHGEWAEESVPSQTARLINPGQTGHYQAESGGDIPILSSIMTGTEGWVVFRTTNASGTTEFFKVSHFLPYWAPRRGAGVEAMRFDPRLSPGSAEFDTRDRSPAEITIKRSHHSPHDELAEVQSLPWLIFWSVGQIFTQPYGDFHWHLNIEVSNTAPPASTTIPFSSAPPPNIDTQPFRFSSPDMWRGLWDSDDGRVTAAISVLANGLLKVSITERSPDGTSQTIEATDVPISRTKPLEAHRLFDSIPVLRRHSELLEQIPRRMVQVERLGGDAFETVDIITREHRLFSDGVAAVAREFEIADIAWKPRQLGGDHLSLPNDAVLEIEQLKADGSVIGYGLRYVRPGFVPVLIASSIDVRLHRRLVVN